MAPKPRGPRSLAEAERAAFESMWIQAIRRADQGQIPVLVRFKKIHKSADMLNKHA